MKSLTEFIIEAQENSTINDLFKQIDSTLKDKKYK